MSDHAGIVDGNLLIDRDATVSGIVSGNVTVAAGCRVKVSGMVEGDLVAEAGAEVTLSGMLSGRVVEHGGRVHVTGMVSGR